MLEKGVITFEDICRYERQCVIISPYYTYEPDDDDFDEDYDDYEDDYDADYGAE